MEAVVQQQVSTLEVSVNNRRIVGVEIHESATGVIQHTTNCPPRPMERIRRFRLWKKSVTPLKLGSSVTHIEDIWLPERIPQ
jgi:hypothetical protein